MHTASDRDFEASLTTGTTMSNHHGRPVQGANLVVKRLLLGRQHEARQHQQQQPWHEHGAGKHVGNPPEQKQNLFLKMMVQSILPVVMHRLLGNGMILTYSTSLIPSWWYWYTNAIYLL